MEAGFRHAGVECCCLRLSHLPQCPSQPLKLLSLLCRPPLQAAADGWGSYTPAQRRGLFETVLVAVHQRAWPQLEARMQAALQRLGA